MKKIESDGQSILIGSLAYALYWVDETMQASLEAAGWERMSRTRSMTMVNIAVGVNRPAALARSLGVSRQAMHQLLQVLKDDGLVEVIPDPKDRRAKVVRFAAGAEGILTDALKIMKGIEKELSARLGKAEFERFEKALNQDWGPISVIDI